MLHNRANKPQDPAPRSFTAIDGDPQPRLGLVGTQVPDSYPVQLAWVPSLSQSPNPPPIFFQGASLNIFVIYVLHLHMCIFI